MKSNHIAEDKKYLDDINNNRVETTRKRVVHALSLLKPIIESISVQKQNKVTVNGFKVSASHAVNLLEAANDEMNFACEHFNWNSDICFQIDEAILDIGFALVYAEDDDEFEESACICKDAAIKLSKALATLNRWFDDSADVSEI